MTLQHVVLFRFAGEDDALECVARLRGMAGRIPVVRRLEAGCNRVPSERGYDVGLVLTLDSLGDLEAYRDHPVHQAVQGWMRENATATVACDFDPDDPGAS